jgi:hypothetical protein
MNAADSITEKVRKLLRLAKSANQHEAELALARAMDLAARHQIDVSTLADDDEIAKLVTRYFRCGGKRLSREWREALSIARTYFNVSTCVMCGQGQVAFIGKATDVQIADYVTQFLVRRCRDELKAFFAVEKRRGRRQTTNKTASFINAFFGGVSVNLAGQRSQLLSTITGLEIVLRDAREARQAHLASDIGETSTQKALVKPRHTMSTLYAGYDAGLKTQINPALGDDAPLALPYKP